MKTLVALSMIASCLVWLSWSFVGFDEGGTPDTVTSSAVEYVAQEPAETRPPTMRKELSSSAVASGTSLSQVLFGTKSNPPAEAALSQSAESEARATARAYYTRDRGPLRVTFMGRRDDTLSGEELKQAYDLVDWADAEALALVIDAEIAGVQSRLGALADEYMTLMDEAFEECLVRGPSEILQGEEVRTAGRQTPDEVHRFEVKVDGVTYVYRMRTVGLPRMDTLLQERLPLIEGRNRAIAATLEAITGEVPTRRTMLVTTAQVDGQ